MSSGALSQIVLFYWQLLPRALKGGSECTRIQGPADRSASARSTSQDPGGFLPGDASRMLLVASGRNVNNRLGGRRLFSSSTESCTGEVTSAPFLQALLFSCCQAVGTLAAEQEGQTRILHVCTCICLQIRTSLSWTPSHRYGNTGPGPGGAVRC